MIAGASLDWVIDTAAAVTLLIAMVLALRGPVARLFGPQYAYALWLLPLARAVLPPVTLTVEAARPTPLGLSALPATASGLPPVAGSPDWTLLFVGLWIAGALALLAHAAIAYFRLRRAIAADMSLVDMSGRVPIVESAAVDGPVALGVLQPLVVLPRDFALLFSPAEQRYVIAHELEHHRGYDLAINLAAFALLAANWFNPIAWAGWRAFRQDQEAACDARTLARHGGDRAIYGRAIAAAVAGPLIRPTAGVTPVFALAMGEKSALMHRLRSLAMTEISPRRRWLGRAALTGAALLALPLTASVSYAIVQPEAPPAPAAPAAPPAAAAAPQAPEPPAAPPGVDIIDLSAAPGEHVRRIERDGRTIILRTNRALSDADVERMVAEAESSREDAERTAGASDDTPRRSVHRIVIRRHGADEPATPAPPAPPTPPVPPADANVRTERRIVMVNRGDAVTMRCRTVVADGEASNAADCANTSREFRLQAVRSARAALRAMPEGQIPTDARTSALAELDALITSLERESGD